jgi:hypothetical protein
VRFDDEDEWNVAMLQSNVAMLPSYEERRQVQHDRKHRAAGDDGLHDADGFDVWKHERQRDADVVQM